MAYRVAELMQRVESATDSALEEAAKRECEDLIIRLWETRDNWPSRGPLHSLMPTLQVLLAASPSRYRWAGRHEPDEVSGLITQLLQVQARELRQLCQLVKAKVPAETVSSMEKLLDEHRADLSDIEINLISLVINPSRLPVFDSEEAAEAYDEDDEQEAQEEDEIVPASKLTKPTSDLAEFIASARLGHEKFLAAITQVLEG